MDLEASQEMQQGKTEVEHVERELEDRYTGDPHPRTIGTHQCGSNILVSRAYVEPTGHGETFETGCTLCLQDRREAVRRVT